MQLTHLHFLSLSFLFVSILGVANSNDLLSPISTAPPPAYFNILPFGAHPCLEKNQNTNAACHLPKTVAKPMHTNKFHQNFMMGHQNQTVFVQPWAVRYQDGNFENRKDWGIGIEHLETDELIFKKEINSQAPAEANSFFHGLSRPALLTYSAHEFSASPIIFDTDGLINQFCTNITVSVAGASDKYIRSPVCQGMAFVTADYRNLFPQIQILNPPNHNGKVPEPAIFDMDSDGNMLKMKVETRGGYDLLIYIIPRTKWEKGQFVMEQRQDITVVSMTEKFDGIIQTAKISKHSKDKLADEMVYDTAAGWYPSTAALNLQVSGDTGAYEIIYSTESDAKYGRPLIFSLPHKVDTASSSTKSHITGVALASRAIGPMVGILSSTLRMEVKHLPVGVGFGLGVKISNDDKQIIRKAIKHEMAGGMKATDGKGTYSNAKRINRLASVCHSALEIEDRGLATRCLEDYLLPAFSPFVKNQQPEGLLYDATFGGIVSGDYFSSFWTGKSQAERINGDFGNTFYNDHHFHYGYLVHASAITGHLHKQLNSGSMAWIDSKREYVQTLIRDFINPSPVDNYFPVFRNFDWFSGHSWANGLFEFGDGRNEESSSEDYNSIYAVKMWGRVTGDAAMEKRSDLMLGVIAGSIQRYMHVGGDLSVHPEQIKANMVSGILWQNKVDWTTWFGSNTEFVNGIHIIPVTPITTYIRSPEFSRKEWETVLSKKLPKNAWESVIHMSVATFDPETAWDFFAKEGFDYNCLDDGLSRSSALVFAAGQKGLRKRLKNRG